MEFWQFCILEGDVGRVGCPDPQCVKDGNLAEEEDVRKVVSTEEEVQRWKWLKEKKELEKGSLDYRPSDSILTDSRSNHNPLSNALLSETRETTCR